jgi:hypothetical protein
MKHVAAEQSAKRGWLLWANREFVWVASTALMVTVWRIKGGQVVGGAIFSLWRTGAIIHAKK